MAPKSTKTIDITAVSRGRFEACLLGTTGLITRRMSQKAAQQLLAPSGRKSAAEKSSTMKHDPLCEYRESPLTNKDPNAETLVQIPSACVKMAMASIPIDLPDTGTSKAQLERLLYAEGDRLSVWGIPQMIMSVVRSADMNHTPDIRTRMIIPQWALRVSITYVMPVLRQDLVVKFLAAAGFMRGIGDWRPEKGSGSYGCFELVEPTDSRFLHVVKTGGRAAQMAAMEAPDFYDDETREMYQWFVGEKERRGFTTTKDGNGESKSRKRISSNEVRA